MVKVTYTLDDATVATIRLTAERLRKPQSQIVREAVQHYAARAARLTDEERREKLRLFDQLLARVPSRSPREVEAEIRDIRRLRRLRGRRHPVD
jgi:hypothetical protein